MVSLTFGYHKTTDFVHKTTDFVHKTTDFVHKTENRDLMFIEKFGCTTINFFF